MKWSVVLMLVLMSCSLVQAQNEQAKFGLERRVPWTTSRITGSPEPPLPYRIERVFGKLKFKNPVILTDSPFGDRMVLAELKGKLFSFPNDPNCDEQDLFFDMASIAEFKQVYGLTFHPNFAENGYCYLCYVLKTDGPKGTRVSRFTVQSPRPAGDGVDRQSAPPQIDPTTEKILLTWPSGGHNGGCLKFGPDGYLYISTGDAGPAFPPDPKKSGQDISNLRSSILRIDVDRATDDRLYSIPSDNPFVGLAGARGEVWAYGFRNPWKISFDPQGGALWVGDVGWEMWEMIYRVQRGGNYGWSLVEGSQPVHRERTRGPTPILPPTVEHSHIESRSITGGHVYRGQRLKELVGAYVYGDYVTGKIWAVRHDGDKVTWLKELVDTSLQIICFGTDRDGELYIVGYDGTIHRLIPNPTNNTNQQFPTKLSKTGLFEAVDKHLVAPGVLPYSINAEPWADGAKAERFVALPGETKLDVYDRTNVQQGYIKGQWKFPTDGVLMKTLSLGGKRIETQILHFDVDTWRAYAYVWNNEQTDATLVPADGMTRKLSVDGKTQMWRIASRSQCLLCHSTRGGSIYGFNAEQMKRSHAYGNIEADQLRTLDHIGLFDQIPNFDVKPVPSPHDKTTNLNDRARTYLHVNCAHCHRRGGGGTAAIELIRDFPIKRTHLLDGRPTQGTFGIHAAEILPPGDPYRSVLYYRMAKLGRGRMPHFGSSVVDKQGLSLIHNWIRDFESDAEEPTSVAKLRVSQDRLLEAVEAAKSTNEATTKAVDQLLVSTSGALRLLRAVDQSVLKPANREFVIAKGIAHEDARIRDLFERFLPEEKRTKRLGTSIKPEQILTLRGDAKRGQTFFFNTAGVQCKNCHRIGKQGTRLGPDLTQIGKKYNRAQLLESILQPSKQIDPKFVTQLAETVNGRVVIGLMVKNTDEEVVLKDVRGKETRIAKEDLERLVPQQKSLMPELLLRDMTAEQVADLIAYLSLLR